jgi:cytidylate kinase
MNAVVTISATFGASGNVVGRAVAQRLGVPFFDRAVPAAVAARLSVPIEDALSHDETGPSALSRLAEAFAGVSTAFGSAPVPSETENPDQFRQTTEKILHGIADSTGGVILGRAGMLVLRERPDVLRVRLDGPLEARIAHVVQTENMTEDQARSMQRTVDGARETYVRAFYRAHQADSGLYHVILDATALGAELCSETIIQLAKGMLGDYLGSAPK